MSGSTVAIGPRRRLRFGLRTLFAIIVAIACALAFLSHRARLQQRAVEALRTHHADLVFAHSSVNFLMHKFEEPPGPRWLRDQIGDDYFQRVVAVGLFGPQADDFDFQHLAHLPGLRELTLSRSTRGAGTDLAPLAALRDLEGLTIDQYGMDDAGLAYVSRAPKLWYLSINGSPLSDAGMPHLGRLRALKLLELNNVGISDAGLEYLGTLDQLTELNLIGAPIRGPGLAHLARLPRLERLNLNSTQIDDIALSHLARMPHLKSVGLHRTGVTPEGIARLRAARPDLTIIAPGR